MRQPQSIRTPTFLTSLAADLVLSTTRGPSSLDFVSSVSTDDAHPIPVLVGVNGRLRCLPVFPRLTYNKKSSFCRLLVPCIRVEEDRQSIAKDAAFSRFETNR